ncbi:2og-fe oxygenase family [Colletotrichum sojae]|uniref:2og-fe oxygenase family n=1 Tax=Colletotrichum sojae TaxID=2175907 RepID=A0A8H6IY83_9PEZI|nr:2og-fe oxygenase family [Colletotrichum sojae]
MTGIVTKLLGLSAYTGLVAVTLPYLQNLDLTTSGLSASLGDVLNFRQSAPTPPLNQSVPEEEQPFICLAQNYTTQIVSLDPLVIYIRDFLNPLDITHLLAAGEASFQPSFVTKNGYSQGTSDRTSSSAGLQLDAPAVQCVLERAARFMGTMLAPGRDEIGPPQLVRYTRGQRFNQHYDWYDAFQPDNMLQRRRSWNRIASFFAILDDGCDRGETWFPRIEAVAPQEGSREKERLWRRHEDGGLAFRPVKGNALFWVNLHANGTGDTRVIHAGLPLGEGRKTAMNIWPRRYQGPEAWGVEEVDVVVDDAEVDSV